MKCFAILFFFMRGQRGPKGIQQDLKHKIVWNGQY